MKETMKGEILFLLSCFQRKEWETLRWTDFLKKKKEHHVDGFEDSKNSPVHSGS